MLKATFCCFRGIGESAEQRLWQAGVHNWHSALKWPRPVFSAGKWAALKEGIAEANAAYDAGLFDYFLNRLTGVEKVRVVPDVVGSIGYLDIETDGLGKLARITTIAIHCEERTQVFVRDRDFSDFLPAVSACKLLITYNGATFDLPLLRREFQIDLSIPHLDLMPVLRAMGCRGGLKAVERTLGVERHYSSGIDGKEAIEQWNRYEMYQEQEALRKLMLYNAEDTLVLKELLSIAYARSMSSYPLPLKLIDRNQPSDLVDQLFC
jgi:hypothetical protein